MVDNQSRIEQLRSAGLSDAQINSVLQVGANNQETFKVSQVEKDPYVEIKGLPSGGRFYKNSFGIPTKLKGMPLKVRDAIALEAMDHSSDNALLDTIFEKRIQGVNPGDILVADELYILAWLREQTFSRSPLTRSFICDRCDHVNRDKIVTLDDLVILSIPDNITDPMICKLPISGDEVGLRFMRRKDRVRLSSYVSENIYRKLEIDDVKILELASIISGKSITDASEYLSDLDPTDFAVLNTFYLKMNFGFTQEAFMKCEKEECGFSSIIPVPFQSGYFLPKIRPDLSNEN